MVLSAELQSVNSILTCVPLVQVGEGSVEVTLNKYVELILAVSNKVHYTLQ